MSAVVLSVVSVLSDPPVIYSRTAPEAQVLDVPGGAELPDERPESQPMVPVVDAAPQARSPQAVVTPDIPGAPVLGQAAPAEVPVVEGERVSELAPLPDLNDAPVVGEGPGAVLPPAEAVEPRVPIADAAPTGDTVPPAAPAAAPSVAEVQGGASPNDDAMPVAPATADATLQTEPTQEALVVPETPAIPVEPELQVEAETPPPAPAPKAAPVVRETVPGLPKIVPRVRTGRLVTIGQDSPSDAQPDFEGADPALQSDRAIDRYARPFENPSARPLVSVVLIDVGLLPAPQEQLKDLPFAVTFALDAEQPDVGDRMALYRNAGQEVVATGSLPDGAAPPDVEVALQGWLNALPEAVALMEVGSGGFQGSRAQAQQIVAILAATGHGLVTYRSGLNPAQQIADRDGVPAGQVFRDIDGADQDSAGIRRFLDQAAFKAGQEGGVIVTGRATPETLAALAEWSLGNRASSVELAPLSAVLLRK